MGLATVATVVGLACPYHRFSWCSAFHFSFSDASQKICPSETLLLSSFGSFSRLRPSSCPQAESRRTNSLLLQCRTSSPGSRPFGLYAWIGGQYPFRSSLPIGFLDQVVARVTTEVTRQLQPLLSGASALQSDVTLSTESAPSQHGPPASQAPAFVQPSVLATASQGQTEVPVFLTPHSASSHFGSVRFIR